MPIRRSVAIVVSVIALSTAVLATPIGAEDEGEGEKLYRSSLAPSKPTDPVMLGVAPGPAPWVLDEGRTEIRVGGRFDVRVKGLLIEGLGTPGTVTTIKASLFCSNQTTPAATTGAAPLSATGDARIKDDVTLPATCLSPKVFIHPNGNLTRYIALSGFRP